MATLGIPLATDLANAILQHYERGKTLAQTVQDRPLLRILEENQKDFAAGLTYVTEQVQGMFMSDTPGFLQGYTADQSLNFSQAQNILQVQYPWKEVAASLWINFTELKKSGITITDHQEEHEHPGREIDILTDILENRIEDFEESWDRTINLMYWQDGTQDALKVPGLLSLLFDNTNQGTTGGLSRATYWWWQNRALVGGNRLVASPSDQTLSRRLRSELRQLRRYQGKPNIAICGSNFLDALELEVSEKGIYTMEGFAKEGKNDLGMAKIRMLGLGVFEYDPTMDDLGMGKRCFILDSRRIRKRPMAQEDAKIMTPERPYQYMVWLHTKTHTATLEATQLNCHGIYEVA